MSSSHSLLRRIGPWAGVVLAILLPVAAGAQLDDATWVEHVNLNADGAQSVQGSDSFAPEPTSHAIEGFTYAISGAVSFLTPGPPNTRATISADYQSALTSLGGSVSGEITFEFLVVETSAPPVSVASVPVMFSAGGTADSEGDASFFTSAVASFSVYTTVETFIEWSALANNQQRQGSFDETTEVGFVPGLGAKVNMVAGASLGAEILENNTSASATAYVDPVIAVADGLIPGGGGATYQDHYEVQLSPGYWALGPTPVEPTTWGDIKSRY